MKTKERKMWLRDAFRKIMSHKSILQKPYYLLTYRRTHPKINYDEINKVIFIAHPDDETIFFGARLMLYSGWLVICMTNGRNRKRQIEFIKVMNKLKAKYLMLDFLDGEKVIWNQKKVCKRIKHIFMKKDQWELILTHNVNGEYGHCQHKQLHELVSKICRNNKMNYAICMNQLTQSSSLLPKELRDKKISLFVECYKSQVKSLEYFNEYFKHEIF